MDAWKQTKLGPDFYVSTWERIHPQLHADHYDANWGIAIAGIEGRFRERFVKPANAIQALDESDRSVYAEGRGFAIVAIDCLLLEALYGYETGKRTDSTKTTGEMFAHLLTSKAQFGGAFDDPGRADMFARNIRNGILHDGETRHGWLVRQGSADGPIVWPDGERLVLNRDAFHRAVKACLDDYFARLRQPDGPDSSELRAKFVERVVKLCDDSKPKAPRG
jgi:hypothetical protein